MDNSGIIYPKSEIWVASKHFIT